MVPLPGGFSWPRGLSPAPRSGFPQPAGLSPAPSGPGALFSGLGCHAPAIAATGLLAFGS